MIGDRLPGRPSLLLDGRRIRTLLELVKAGTPRYQAGLVCGVSSSTMMRWLRDGGTAERKLEEGLKLDRNEERFRKFRERLLRAEAYFESRTVSAVLAIAERTAKPAVMLEVLRRHPATRERWLVPDKLEISAIQSDDPPALGDVELAAVIERLHRIALEREGHNGPAAAEARGRRGRAQSVKVKKETANG